MVVVKWQGVVVGTVWLSMAVLGPLGWGAGVDGELCGLVTGGLTLLASWLGRRVLWRGTCKDK